MNYFKASLAIICALAASRFIPHPPNFTSLIALSFYIPAILGVRYLPILIFGFFITDLIIGFHSVVLFTWGSVILIGLSARFFNQTIFNRISGTLLGVGIFFLITNFGVWSLGSYGYSLNGLITCFTLALPFLGYSFISAIIFSTLIETVLKFYNFKTRAVDNKR